jgi:hypothetical protein
MEHSLSYGANKPNRLASQEMPPQFMEPEISQSYSQKAAISLCPEPATPSPSLLTNHFNIILHSTGVVSSYQAFQTM